jgi:hypothetical protein
MGRWFFMDRFLRVADLPTCRSSNQPSSCWTAKALGLAVPPMLLARTDEVIE